MRSFPTASPSSVTILYFAGEWLTNLLSLLSATAKKFCSNFSINDSQQRGMHGYEARQTSKEQKRCQDVGRSATVYSLLFCTHTLKRNVSVGLFLSQRSIKLAEADPGFLFGGAAPPRNGVTDW